MRTQALVPLVILLCFAVNVEADPTRLQGAGATFPNPYYQKAITAFQERHDDIRVDYQSLGSGGGIKGITQKAIDFAGSDVPLNSKTLEAVKEPLVCIPTVAGAVVLGYNLPGVEGELNLTGTLLADIFLGHVTRWNDPQVVALNPALELPDLPITPTWKSDASGSTYLLTHYLSSQDDEFRRKVGAGKSVRWPVGQGGKGGEGITGAIRSTVGAIGYLELNVAEQNDIPHASLGNEAGRFVRATPKSATAAIAAAAAGQKVGQPVDLLNQAGEKVYPICGFTYLVVYRDVSYLRDRAKARALVAFLDYVTGDGQALAADLGYAPLAPAARAKTAAAIGSLTFDGKPLRDDD